VDAADLALSAARGGQLAASLSAFGVAVFWSAVAPPVLQQADEATRGQIDARLRRLFRASLGVAFAAALAWLAVEATVIAEAGSIGEATAALWPMLTDTRFGHVLAIRLCLLALTGLALGNGSSVPRRALAAATAGLALILHAWSAHAAATGGSNGAILLGAESLHLLAAGAWLGSLAPLFILAGALPPDRGFRAARRFSPLGILCVLILAGTALAQGWILIGGLAGLIGTDYGWVALAKLALFLVLLALAAANRLRHTPALGGPGGEAARRRLRRSIAAETIIGLAVVLAAALLADLPPALHEQPVWPFAWRPSLENLFDPDYGPEVQGALLAIGGALVLVIVGLIWRAALPLLLIAAAGIVIWATPHLDLLLVEAYPTSFYRSPTGFTAATIARGAELYASNCTGCHGAQGRGDGPAAQSLPVPPADLTAEHLWAHSDGELYWWLSHGIEASRGALAMPGFADRLSGDDRWALIDYVHANNAGMTVAATGRWKHAVPPPDLYATCSSGRVVTIASLRGQVVRIIASNRNDATAAMPSLPATPLTTIQLSRDPQMRPTAKACVATDPAAWSAYAIISGADSNGLTETQFLVDPQGWLRARWRPGDPASWAYPQFLEAEIDRILAHPLAGSAGGGHVHYQ
jgi:putative copper export protein/mono/diheme cytochrome c family protein